MAHGFVQSFDERLHVASAGTKPAGQVNPYAVKVMNEIGLDISHHTSDNVDMYINEPWDYVITVCGGAKEVCPAFIGDVKHRLHIGFDDPFDAEGKGDEAYVVGEYIRIRDEIKVGFTKFFEENIKPNL